LTVFDAYVNLLRTQTEAMSAALAGVDSISVLPFDHAFKTPDEFSERIARNQQLILKEECHFDKVVDPAAGSYYIEILTQSLADAAWKLFLEAEDQGGFAAIAHKGDVQRAVHAMSQTKKSNLATRRSILLGTNQYPNFTEQAGASFRAPCETPDKIETSSGVACGCSGIEGGEITKLNFARGASEFEALRFDTEKSGKTPKVFMLTIGNLAMRLARSQFASNFFACAGYEIIDNLGFETVEGGIRAAREKNADIIVLCSSDEEYTALAPEAYRLIEGKEIFVVAGAPACMDDLKAAGIEHFIHLKSNVLESLQQFNRYTVFK
jgi:methylmalonyl-CoA mutase